MISGGAPGAGGSSISCGIGSWTSGGSVGGSRRAGSGDGGSFCGGTSSGGCVGGFGGTRSGGAFSGFGGFVGCSRFGSSGWPGPFGFSGPSGEIISTSM